MNYFIFNQYAFALFKRYDFLAIRYENSSGISKSTGRICGENIPDAIESHGAVYVEFISDYSVTKRGFRLSFEQGKIKIIYSKRWKIILAIHIRYSPIFKLFIFVVVIVAEQTCPTFTLDSDEKLRQLFPEILVEYQSLGIRNNGRVVYRTKQPITRLGSTTYIYLYSLNINDYNFNNTWVVSLILKYNVEPTSKLF